MDFGEPKDCRKIGYALCLLELISCTVFIFFCVKKYHELSLYILLPSYTLFLVASLSILVMIIETKKRADSQEEFEIFLTTHAIGIMKITGFAEAYDAYSSSMKKIPKMKIKYMFAVWRVLFSIGTISFLATSFTKIL